MKHMIRSSAQWVFPIFAGGCLLTLLAFVRPAQAITQIPTPPPQPGSYGLEAVKRQPPPKVGATISTPGSGSSFSTSPITVNGICPTGLLVQVYDNGVMVGSVMCANGSFSMQVSLFAGTNELSALVFDELDQPGPKSNIVTVTYSNTQFTAFGAQVTLTSSYGRRSSAAGTELGWPLQLSGGTGPYAFSVDWGDGAPVQLKSQSLGGVVAIAHTYKKAGIYAVNVRATDVHGVSAFLQVVALANGKVDGTATGDKTDDKTTAQPPEVLWIPTAVSLVSLLPAFWLGRMSQVVSLQKKMLKERDSYKQKK
jgi:hypothetical protein